jgi:hypothetical protein
MQQSLIHPVGVRRQTEPRNEEQMILVFRTLMRNKASRCRRLEWNDERWPSYLLSHKGKGKCKVVPVLN